jgi:hypothetical protein
VHFVISLIFWGGVKLNYCRRLKTNSAVVPSRSATSYHTPSKPSFSQVPFSSQHLSRWFLTLQLKKYSGKLWLSPISHIFCRLLNIPKGTFFNLVQLLRAFEPLLMSSLKKSLFHCLLVSKSFNHKDAILSILFGIWKNYSKELPSYCAIQRVKLTKIYSWLSYFTTNFHTQSTANFEQNQNNRRKWLGVQSAGAQFWSTEKWADRRDFDDCGQPGHSLASTAGDESYTTIAQ